MDKSERIKGFDLARAVALFIMVAVNFRMALGTLQNDGVLFDILNVLQGKGAALFAVLAGAGISLMIKKSLFKKNEVKLTQSRVILFKRSLFIFICGLFFILRWPTGILLYYGFYILIAALSMTYSSRKLLISIILIIISYPILIEFVDYEKSWNWVTYEYLDLWTINRFLHNLFINGFNPVLPWIAFILSGIWLGRQDLQNKKRSLIVFLVSLSVFISTYFLSYLLLAVSPIYDISSFYFGIGPMPPMPLFMISGITCSFVIIVLCIWLTEKWRTKNHLGFLIKTGQMAFTHYILHIIIITFVAHFIFGETNVSAFLILLYALIFCCLSVLFSILWSKKFGRDPFSKFMRHTTG